MSKYRRRVVAVDAFQWVGELDEERDPEWIFHAIETRVAVVGRHHNGTPLMFFRTLDSHCIARPGYWIVRDSDGRIYPLSASVFRALYEPVET